LGAPPVEVCAVAFPAWEENAQSRGRSRRIRRIGRTGNVVP